MGPPVERLSKRPSDWAGRVDWLWSTLIASKFKPAVVELRALEKMFLHPRGKTAALRDYIADRRVNVKDSRARQELKQIAQRLRDHRNLNFALDDVREALAAVFVDASGIDGRSHQQLPGSPGAGNVPASVHVRMSASPRRPSGG